MAEQAMSTLRSRRRDRGWRKVLCAQRRRHQTQALKGGVHGSLSEEAASKLSMREYSRNRSGQMKKEILGGSAMGEKGGS